MAARRVLVALVCALTGSALLLSPQAAAQPDPRTTTTTVADATTTTKADGTTTSRKDGTTTTRTDGTTTTRTDRTTTTRTDRTTTTRLDGTTTSKAESTTTVIVTTTSPQPTTTVPPGGAVVAGTVPTSCKPNRVKNSGFEQVTGQGTYGWEILDAGNTQVPFWTRTSAPALIDKVKHQSDPVLGLHSAYDGQRYAVLLGYANGVGRPSLVNGPLSSPATGGKTYNLSARVVRAPIYPEHGPGALEMRLRRASDGAESSPVAHVTVTEQQAWTLVGGQITVAPLDTYDSVVLRSYQESGSLFVDDVRLCVKKSKPFLGGPLVVGVIGVGLAVLVLGGLGGTIWWRRRVVASPEVAPLEPVA